MSYALWLHKRVEKVAPIEGVTEEGHVWFGKDATDAEKSAALQAVKDSSVAVYDAEMAEVAKKASDYDSDAARKTLWGKVDSLSKDEFKAYLQNSITDLPTAKSALIQIALEVARMRRS